MSALQSENPACSSWCSQYYNVMELLLSIPRLWTGDDHNQGNFPGAKLVVGLVITKTNIFTLELVVIILIIYFVIQ